MSRLTVPDLIHDIAMLFAPATAASLVFLYCMRLMINKDDMIANVKLLNNNNKEIDG